MRKLNPIPQEPSPDPVSLAAAAVNNLIQTLPAGTAFFIGIVLVVMMTGRLVQTKGSLARATLPFVLHLRWGWHRVERAMERGKFSLDAFVDRAYGWCVANLPVEPVYLGAEQREVVTIDSATIARLRAVKRLALAGKGYCHRAGRAVRANIVAVITSVVMIRGVRVGLVPRTMHSSVACGSMRSYGVLPHPPPVNRGVRRCMVPCCTPGERRPSWLQTERSLSLESRVTSGCGAGTRSTMRSFPTFSSMLCGLMTRPITNRWWSARRRGSCTWTSFCLAISIAGLWRRTSLLPRTPRPWRCPARGRRPPSRGGSV